MSASKFRLYHSLQLAAHQLQKIADRDLLEKSGLTTAQAGVLSAISEKGAITQKDVADCLLLNESAVTAMVNRLMKMGCISRERDEKDKRAWVLKLTASGQDALEKTKAPFSQINGVIEEAIAKDDIEGFVDKLNSLTKAFEGK